MAKSALHARFKANTSLEEEGIWTDFGEGIRVRIRRFKSRPVQDAKKKHEMPFTGEIRKGPLPEATATLIMNKIIAEGVIADWEGITNEDGEGLPPTFENKLGILSDESLSDFRDEIFAIAVERENFKAALDQDAEGN